VTNEKKRKNSRDYISFWQRTNLVFFSLFDLGDQTRTSLGQVQKKVSEMVPKQGMKIKTQKKHLFLF